MLTPLRFFWRWLVLAALLPMAACQQLPTGASYEDIPPLVVDSGPVTAVQASERLNPPDPLVLSDDMKAFVDRYVLSAANSSRQRLTALNASIRGSSILGVRYDAEKTGTAEEVFSSGSANCLGFSHLFVAMARYAGLDARFQQVVVKPQWSRRGDVLTVNKHINVTGKAGRNVSYTVDIDEDNFRRAQRMYEISDSDARLQYYNNLAMEAMTEDDLETAYAFLVKALRLDGSKEFLWTNLGYVFRRNDQYDEAAASYDRALDLAPGSTTALQNYQVLHHHLGNEREVEELEKKLAGYRRNNPYYYAQQSRLAAAEEDWDEALKQIGRALDRKPEEFEFHLARLAYLALDGQADRASALLPEARTLAEKPHQKAQLADYIEHWELDDPGRPGEETIDAL